MSEHLDTIGRYQLVHPLGQGGMGTVYLAHDTELDREVAIKCFLLRDQASGLAAQLRHEATLLAQLNHPNVIQVYDVVEEHGRLGIVMEYVKGQSLLTRRKEALPEQQQVLHWLTQVADGLQAAHQAGIIHCDLKPDNILISLDNTAKIGDFGIARAHKESDQSESANMQHMVSGSYSSVSPEQARGEKVDFRTDIFSFGLLAYQLLTGHHAFGQSNNPSEIAQRIVNEKFEFKAADSRLLSPALLQLISDLLQQRPQDRPASIGQVGERLKQIRKQLGEQSLPAEDATVMFDAISPKPSVWQRKPIRALIASALLAVAVVVSWLNWPQQQTPVRYVAVLDPQISTVNGFDADQQRQVYTTIKTSLQEGLLNTAHLALIPDTRLSDFDGSISNLGRAVAADAIVKISADCTLTQCQLDLQKLAGENWRLASQRSWPVVATSMSDIRSTLLQELPRLFSLASREQAESSISEEAYRRYLALYHAGSAGVTTTEEQLQELAELQRSARTFFPLYDLYSVATLHLFNVTGDNSYLTMHAQLMAKAPASLARLAEFRQLEFKRMLSMGEQIEAQRIIDELEETSADRVIINDMLASLAFSDNDLATAAALDRKNAILRPSAKRYYNLAVDEYMLGNFDAAAEAVEKSLQIAAMDTDSQNLRAAIAMGRGQLDQAISSYRILVENDPDSINLSNLGVSLMLKGDYSQAILFLQRALSLKPDDPKILLNLADNHGLIGDTEIAANYYHKVLKATEKESNESSYRIRAQAHAHLGNFNKAIKSLQLAGTSSEHAYASAIVHSLAGNFNAAIVEVENAVEAGTSIAWFHFKWFAPLCDYPLFRSMVVTNDSLLCTAR